MLSLKDLRHLDRDDLLETLGLQRRNNSDWVAPAMAALGVGLLIGAGLGLLLAPKSGSELREELRERLEGGLDSLPGRGEKSEPTRTPSAT